LTVALTEKEVAEYCTGEDFQPRIGPGQADDAM